jgi:outer membrane protein assembly factor BamD (BamD/ComL family)
VAGVGLGLRDGRGANPLERNAPESAELTYKVAKLYFELGDYQQVTLEAQRVQARYETSPFVDDAMLLEAQALAMMEGRAPEALRVFERLVERLGTRRSCPTRCTRWGS